MKTLKNNWGFGGGPYTATQSDITFLKLLGAGGEFEGVTFTRDQMKVFGRFYGTLSKEEVEEHRKEVLESILSRPRPVEDDFDYPSRYESALTQWKEDQTAAPEGAVGSSKLREAGVRRDVFRQVRRDGMRIMALLTPFLTEGEDPVKTVAGALMDAGYDIDPSIISEFFYED